MATASRGVTGRAIGAPPRTSAGQKSRSAIGAGQAQCPSPMSADRLPALRSTVAEQSAVLLERDDELAEVDAAIARLSAERLGGVLTIAASAGVGKTALVDRLADAAALQGARVLRVAPGPLERH